MMYGDIISCISMNDKLNALSATGQAVSSSVDLRQEGHIINDNTVNPPVSYSVGQSTYFVIKSHVTYQHSPETVESATDLHSLHCCQRMALLGVDLCTEIITPEAQAAAAKKGGAKKGVPAEPLRPRRMLKYRMQIVDMYKSNERDEVLYVKVHDIHFDCPFDYSTYDHLFALHDYVSIGLNHNGTLLSLIVGEDPALCRVYQLQGVLAKVASQIVEERDEDLASVDHMASPRFSSQPAVLKTPVIIAQWKVACGVGSGEKKRNVMECVFLYTHIPSSLSQHSHALESAPSPEQDPFVSLQPHVYGHVKLLLRVRHCPYLVRMRLALKPEDLGQNTNKKQEKPKDKGKGAVDIPQPPPIACDVLEDKRISLSSPPSALSLFRDENDCQYLVVGQEDGVVSMWNISQDLLVTPLGSHPSPITFISATNVNCKVDIVVGALDGTLTYYNNTPADSNDFSLTALLEGKPVLGLEKTAFVNYRQDAWNDSIVHILPLPHVSTSDKYHIDAVLVQYGSDTQVIYSLPDLSIVATLNAVERVNFMNLEATRIASANIPLRRFIPIPVDPLPPVEEPPAEPAKGKGGKSVEPPPEEEKEEEPPPPEPLEFARNTVGKAAVAQLRSLGYSLERFVEVSAVFFNTKKGKVSLLMHAYRDEHFVLSWFDISNAIARELAEGGGEDGDKALAGIFVMRESPSMADQHTSRKGSRGGVLKGSKLKEIYNLSNKALKLTEERLEEHQRQLDKTQRVHSSAASVQSAAYSSTEHVKGTMRISKLDPVEAVKAEMIASRRAKERNRGKNSLAKTLQTLASFC
ncbi:hypothetical protein EON65_14820 [archaeon]|nr:MAG: hypothetical protein EON65_14820 [archaeon]